MESHVLHLYSASVTLSPRAKEEMAVWSYLLRGLSTLFLLWLTYLFVLVVYRLYFHPLARFPGPKYAAISRWHEYYHEVVRKGQFTFVVQEYHKKYGR